MPRTAKKSGSADKASDLLSTRPTERTLHMEPRREEQHYKIPPARREMPQVAEPAVSYKAEPSVNSSGVARYMRENEARRGAGVSAQAYYKKPSDKEGAAGYDERIAEARAAMEAAAKSCDFVAAARLRDKMYELIQQRDTTDRVSYKK